jgi:hypothetical protein
MSIDPTNNHSINLDITPTQLAVGHKRHNGRSLVPGYSTYFGQENVLMIP